MKFNHFTKLATVSAFALCLAYSTQAKADPVENGDPFTVDATAEVTNTYDATSTPLDFGTINVTPHGVDTALATLDPDGTFNEDIGGTSMASITDVDSSFAVAVVTATLLPADTEITVTYGTLVGLTDGSSTLELTGLVDNLDAPDDGVGDTAGVVVGGINTIPGVATTTTDGELTFSIGGTIETNVTDDYQAGTYDGSFDVTLTY